MKPPIYLAAKTAPLRYPNVRCVRCKFEWEPMVERPKYCRGCGMKMVYAST